MTRELPKPRFLPQALPDVLLVEPVVYRDGRGFFLETWSERIYRDAGVPAFVQDNLSSSARNTLRGLHAQLRRPQGKLIRVVEGSIYDVAVDIRSDSPTFGKWVGITLDARDLSQVYIPPGFAHGFFVRSPQATVSYKTTDYYDPDGELTIAWNDPDLGIDWPSSDPLLSSKDATAPRMAEVKEFLPTMATAGERRG